MRKVAMFVVTDGRLDCLTRTLESFHEKCDYDFMDKFIVNDSVDEQFRKDVSLLADKYGFYLINHEVKRGFAGVYNTAWSNIEHYVDYVFSTEDDFLFNEKIDIDNMIDILNYNRNLIQVSLKRQAWGEAEVQAGGFVEQFPDLYENKEHNGLQWCEHRVFYTTNPSLTPRFVFERGWAMCEKSEHVMSNILFDNPNFKSSMLGHKFDAPKVFHIGENRVGVG